jgi:D-alanyl-D-alanine carboxypeptidase
MRVAITALLLWPVAALAQSAFDGTWTQNLESMKVTGKADEFQVLEGVYTCMSCVPEVKVKADGSDQAVTGHPYYDTVAVTVVSNSSIHVINKLGGKQTFNISYSVSGDGKTLTAQFQDFTGSQVATGTFTETRRKRGATGSHPVSGTWQPEALTNANAVATTITYQMTNDQFSMHWNGQSYNARFDGQPVRVTGDPGNTMVTLKRIDNYNVVETDSRNGKVTDEVHLAAARDGKTIDVTDHDLLHHQITTFTLDRQGVTPAPTAEKQQ